MKKLINYLTLSYFTYRFVLIQMLGNKDIAEACFKLLLMIKPSLFPRKAKEILVCESSWSLPFKVSAENFFGQPILFFPEKKNKNKAKSEE